MDTWIVSYTQTLLDFVKQEMDGETNIDHSSPVIRDSFTLLCLAYRLYTVVPRLVKYIDMLTNWYVKLNKKRFKVTLLRQCVSFHVHIALSHVQGESTLDDCLVSLNVLCYVLLTMAKLMGPFTPFLAEYMYQILRKLMGPSSSSSSSSEQELSVHFQMMPRSQFVSLSLPR